MQLLARRGCDPRYGARPLRRLIESEIETEIGLLLLNGEAPKNLVVAASGEEFRVGEDRHACAGLSLDVASAAR